jgi:hypothetical protein
MKRTLLAAVLGGLVTFFAGAFTAQAAPVPAMQAPQAGTSLVQTTGYGYHHRRYYHRHHYHRPYVRWHSHRHYRPYYATPRFYYHTPRRHYWTHRYHRRHYH